MVLFLKVFLTEFIAEMGDKTQLMLIALTSKYKLKDIILGTAAAILVLNGMAVLAGGLVSEFIPDWLIKTIAALAFLYFAASTISGDDDEEEEEGGKSKIRFAPLAVFCTFFVAELGDKTQLTAITFGANEGMGSAFVVWIGCSLGLFAADILGMLVGYLLKSKTLVIGSWKIMEILLPRSFLCCSFVSFTMSSPSSRISPSAIFPFVPASNPITERDVTLFPLPDSPTMPSVAPRRSSTSTPSTALITPPSV